MAKTTVLRDATCAGCGKVIKKGGRAVRTSWKTPSMATSHFAYYHLAYYHPACYKRFKARKK